MSKKKKVHPILKILGLFFIVFIALYIANISGYYEGKIRHETSLTEEEIKSFEEKVQNGEAISLDAYISHDIVDYSNSVSKLGDHLTSGIEIVVTKGSKFVGDIIKSLF